MAAMVPMKPKKILRRVAQQRLRQLVKASLPITVQGMEFWNALAGKSGR